MTFMQCANCHESCSVQFAMNHAMGKFPANNITSCSREYDVPRGPGNVAFTLGFTFSSRKNVGTK